MAWRRRMEFWTARKLSWNLKIWNLTFFVMVDDLFYRNFRCSATWPGRPNVHQAHPLGNSNYHYFQFLVRNSANAKIVISDSFAVVVFFSLLSFGPRLPSFSCDQNVCCLYFFRRLPFWTAECEELLFWKMYLLRSTQNFHANILIKI